MKISTFDAVQHLEWQSGRRTVNGVCVSRNEPRVPLVPPFLIAVPGSEGPRLPVYRGVSGFYQLIRRLRLRRRRPNAYEHASSPPAAFGAAGGAVQQSR